MFGLYYGPYLVGLATKFLFIYLMIIVNTIINET